MVIFHYYYSKIDNLKIINIDRQNCSEINKGKEICEKEEEEHPLSMPEKKGMNENLETASFNPKSPSLVLDDFDKLNVDDDDIGHHDTKVWNTKVGY